MECPDICRQLTLALDNALKNGVHSINIASLNIQSEKDDPTRILDEYHCAWWISGANSETWCFKRDMDLYKKQVS